MRLVKPASPPAWREPLEALGFRDTRGGNAVGNATAAFASRDGWGVLESTRRAPRDALRGSLDHAGLWKCVGGSHRPLRRVFELPPGLLPGASRSQRLHGAGGAKEFRDAVRWALETEHGNCPATWSSPPRDEIERHLPENGLTLETATAARQGSLLHGPDRLALQFEVLSEVPPDLPDARRAWLRELLIDAQERWRLVRIGWTDESAVRAVVDLTGVPYALLEALLRVALDALRLVVCWIVEPAELLVDCTARCRALETRPRGPRPQEGDRT